MRTDRFYCRDIGCFIFCSLCAGRGNTVEGLGLVEETGSLAFDVVVSSDHRESCKSVTLEGSEDVLLVLLEDGVELNKTVLEIADDSSCVIGESPQADI